MIVYHQSILCNFLCYSMTLSHSLFAYTRRQYTQNVCSSHFQHTVIDIEFINYKKKHVWLPAYYAKYSSYSYDVLEQRFLEQRLPGIENTRFRSVLNCTIFYLHLYYVLFPHQVENVIYDLHLCYLPFTCDNVLFMHQSTQVIFVKYIHLIDTCNNMAMLIFHKQRMHELQQQHYPRHTLDNELKLTHTTDITGKLRICADVDNSQVHSFSELWR